MNYKTTWSMLRQTFFLWYGHDAPRLGAALAFYTILALAPLVILVIALLGLLFGDSSAKHQLVGQAYAIMGRQGADAVKGLIEQAQQPVSGAYASILGIGALLFGASGVFSELRSALNGMWHVIPKSEGAVWETIKQRFFSFGMVLAVGFLLLVSLLVTAGFAAIGAFFGEVMPVPKYVLSTISFTISVAATTALFALIFRFLPETKIDWRDIWIGATFTAFLFTIGKFLIGFYLRKAAVGSAYGAAGSLVVVIVWVYYSAMIFLFGAQFTHVLAVNSEDQK